MGRQKWIPGYSISKERGAGQAGIAKSALPGMSAFAAFGNTKEFLKFLVLRTAGQALAFLLLGGSLQSGSQAYGAIMGSFILFCIMHVAYLMRPSGFLALLFALPIAAVELIQIAFNPLFFLIDVMAAAISVLTISERQRG